ncbi:MAG: hypothetical protein ACREDR_44375, partial [Blastocatellia bacterium]
MTAQATSPSTASTNRPLNWKALRVGVGLAYLICEVVVLTTTSPLHGAGPLTGNLAFAAIGLTASFLAYQNARSFSSGQTARWAWILIAAMPLADVVAYTAYTMPAYLGVQARSAAFIVIATASLSISRIAAAGAFYAMVRVYRRSGLSHRLVTMDYLVMALVLVMEVFALGFSGNRATGGGDPQLAKLILITAIPLVIALVPCSIFGVIIWRYTTEMGGGLVAKAWRGALLYGVFWLSYLTFNSIVARYFPFVQGQPLSTANLLVFAFTTWQLKGSEYLIFLGASYQYEACTSAPDFSSDLGA